MAICNIFKPLTKETGTFLTFSQYMEDLTAQQTETKFHRVVPSKFIALDITPSSYDNETFPKTFQDGFENACACFKNTLSSWDPTYSKVLFWNFMFDEVITENDIKYIGDINLQSYNEVDGIGYSEIYCHIPNDAQVGKYQINRNGLNIEDIKINKKGNDDFIEGFKPIEPTTSDIWFLLSKDYTYLIDQDYEFTKTETLSDKSFNINALVVLYDIWNGDNLIASEVPMGIYITGLINSGVIENSITKYVSNGDIYNSGTSYGLRICSRYVVSNEQDNYTVKEVSCEDNNYGELCKVLSQLSVSQIKMDEIINKTYNTEQNYKNLLAIFKNSRTNVPYLKTINGKKYWFINGRIVDEFPNE